MSKRAEEYANAQYPQRWVNKTPTSSDKVDYNEHARWAAGIAYEQAEKDTIERIREQVKQWMPEKDGEEHTCGERLAFNSVLHLLEEMEKE